MVGSRSAGRAIRQGDCTIEPVKNRSPRVLIVGAGPTGLALGIGLRRQGVDCCIIDRLQAPLPYSRALGLHARTLEIFAAMEVLAPIRQAAKTLKATRVHGDRGPLFTLDLTLLQAPYPWILSCPQSRVETALADRYRTLGGRLERGVELLDFRQDGKGVQARLRRGTSVESHDYDLMVGSDGVHSVVREQLGVGFAGLAYREHFLLADVNWQAPWPSDMVQGFLQENGLLLALPMPQAWRLILTQLEEPPDRLSLVPFQARLEALLGQAPELGEPLWLSHFSVQRRLADHYRRNRVFLAGDAAHAQSPMGGQGMNTGIADAFNLSWKLALYLKGNGRGELLDSYERERRPVARRMLYSVDGLSRASLLQRPWLRWCRDWLFKLIGPRVFFQKRFLRTASQLQVNYRGSALLGHGPGVNKRWRRRRPVPGDRVPDAALVSLRTGHHHQLHDLLKQPVHHLLLQLSAEPDSKQQLVLYALSDRLGEEHAERVHLTVIVAADGEPGSLPQEGTTRIWQDHHGTFAKAFGQGDGLWLMRPDGHLAYRAPVSDGDHLLAYLERLFAMTF